MWKVWRGGRIEVGAAVASGRTAVEAIVSSRSDTKPVRARSAEGRDVNVVAVRTITSTPVFGGDAREHAGLWSVKAADGEQLTPIGRNRFKGIHTGRIFDLLEDL